MTSLSGRVSSVFVWAQLHQYRANAHMVFREKISTSHCTRSFNLYFFLGLCDYPDKFPKMFSSSCGGECPSIANFCHQCGQQINLSQISNKAASVVDEEKLLKKYFHRGYPYAALIMCTNDCGCFKVLWSILSLILGASD